MNRESAFKGRRRAMGSSKADVEVSYDVSNEFFRLWLDERMNYTSAVYESWTQSLEAAQLNKLKILSDFAKVTPEKTCARHRLRLGRLPRVRCDDAQGQGGGRRDALALDGRTRSTLARSLGERASSNDFMKWEPRRSSTR
jgi:hypothetical protein